MASRRGLQAAAPKLLSLGESGLVRELLLAQLSANPLLGGPRVAWLAMSGHVHARRLLECLHGLQVGEGLVVRVAS